MQVKGRMGVSDGDVLFVHPYLALLFQVIIHFVSCVFTTPLKCIKLFNLANYMFNNQLSCSRCHFTNGKKCSWFSSAIFLRMLSQYDY